MEHQRFSFHFFVAYPEGSRTQNVGNTKIYVLYRFNLMPLFRSCLNRNAIYSPVSISMLNVISRRPKNLFARRWRRPVAFSICRQWYTTLYFPFRGGARNRWPLASHALCSLFRVWVWEKCRPGVYQLVFVLNSNLLRDLKWSEKRGRNQHTHTHQIQHITPIHPDVNNIPFAFGNFKPFNSRPCGLEHSRWQLHSQQVTGSRRFNSQLMSNLRVKKKRKFSLIFFIFFLICTTKSHLWLNSGEAKKVSPFVVKESDNRSFNATK